MLNRDVIAKWVAALKSGEYKQAKRTLQRTAPHPYEEYAEYSAVGFCCLGVLCDLAVKAEVIPPPVITRNCEAEYATSSAFLPREVAEWAGLGSMNPSVAFDREDSTTGTLYTSNAPLSNLNDERGKTFVEIA